MNEYQDHIDRWRQVRCLFEAPILDDHKFSKVPDIPADAFILDMEDSAAPTLKDEVRRRVVEYVKDPEYFGGRMTIARVNHLSTPWGRDDVIALAEAGVDQIMYPKTESVEDVHEVLELARAHGADPVLRVSIESARGVLEVDRIVAMEEVVCVGCGVGDLHADTGQPLYDDDGSLFPGHYYPKLKTVMAAAAYGKARLGFPQLPNLRDLEEYRRRAIIERKLGFEGCSSFYPPQVPILLDVFSVSPAEAARAREVIEIYEAAVAEGRNAVQLPDGSALLVHQYKQAQATLARVR